MKNAMSDIEKLNILRKILIEIEDTASCVIGLDDDNKQDGLREIIDLVRKLPKNILKSQTN